MPDSTLHVRLATQADQPRLIPHINAAFARAEPFMSGPRTDAHRLADTMAKGQILLAEDDAGRLIASVYTEVRGPRGYIGMLAVDPAHQGAGLGRRMMIEAENCLRGRGCEAVDITVLSIRTELPPLYRKFGYVETGTEVFEYPHPLKDGLETHLVVMSKSL